MAKKNKTNIIEEITNARDSRDSKIRNLTSTISVLQKQEQEVLDRIIQAETAEDIEAYRSAKSERSLITDSIELYQKRINSLERSPLFEDTHDTLNTMRAEQAAIEEEAMNEIMPLLNKAYDIADKAKDRCNAISELLPTVLKNSGIHTSQYNPMKLNGVLFSINDIEAPKQEHWWNK